MEGWQEIGRRVRKDGRERDGEGQEKGGEGRGGTDGEGVGNGENVRRGRGGEGRAWGLHGDGHTGGEAQHRPGESGGLPGMQRALAAETDFIHYMQFTHKRHSYV